MSDPPLTSPSPQEEVPASLRRLQRPLVTLDYNPLLAYFKVEDGDSDANAEHRADAAAVRSLIALQSAGVIRLMVTIASAMENQPRDKVFDIQAWSSRLTALGLDSQDIFASPLPLPFSTPDAPDSMTFGPDYDMWMNMLIYAILNQGNVEPGAKNIDAQWLPYRDRMCRLEWERADAGEYDPRAFAELDRLRGHSGNLPPKPTPALDRFTSEQKGMIEHILTKVYRQWNNAKCDASGLVIHASHALRPVVPNLIDHAAFVTSDRKILRLSTWDKLQMIRYPGSIIMPQKAVAYFENFASC